MRRALAVPLLIVLLLAGCGDDDDGGGGDKPTLKVSAAASLKEAFTTYATEFDEADVKLSFAGSDELAAQLRQGANPDVFASANTKLPAQLFAEGLVEKPVPFTANRLVLAVPKDSDIRTVAGAGASGVKVAIGAEGVPIGDYTREVLRRFGPAGDRILDNVRSNEPDVKSIVAKLTQGGAGAGFVYVTDVTATGGALRAIEIPPAAQPRVVYAAAVVQGTKHPDQARAFVDGLLEGPGQEALTRAGFERPPT
jgi:molybdate transport system substrate-binding protein